MVEIKPEHVLGAMLPGRALLRTPVSSVLDVAHYQLVQIEAPQVRPSELRAAVRWQLRDMIDFPLEDAVIDVFELPRSRAAERRTLWVVAARAAAVERIATLLAPRARRFDTIDIPEMSLRNLSALLPQDQEGVAMLALGEGFAHLLLTRQGNIYLTRRLELGAQALQLGADDEADVDLAKLTLEIQRSLDYYESQYDLPAITQLVLAPANARAQQLRGVLQEQLSATIELFSPERWMAGADDLELDHSWSSLMALGAALRAEQPGA